MKKTYVITGVTSGIGKATAEYFISKGNTVWGGYRNKEKPLPNGIIPFYINSTDPETIAEAANLIKSKTDKIDTLINISGCVVAGAIETTPISELRRQFEVNVFAHLDLSQRLLPLISDKIINISSMASFGNFPFISPYCASKRALDILFNSLGNETKHKINIVSIKPGVIATPLWEKSIEENQKYFSTNKDFEKEMIFMVNNAKSNGKNGLSVEKVVEVIAKADKSKKTKSSYTVGIDAKLAEIASHLPQEFINKLIRYKLKHLSETCLPC